VKVVNYEGFPHTIVETSNSWGINYYKIASPPPRLWADDSTTPPAIRSEIDPYETKSIPSPAEFFAGISENDNWQAMSRRSLARFHALTLLAEDPQRRFDARPVSTLAHQMSLVRHILDHREMQRVLIADEVGLGKTIEAG
jgi:hypothetical protein